MALFYVSSLAKSDCRKCYTGFVLLRDVCYYQIKELKGVSLVVIAAAGGKGGYCRENAL